MWRKRKPELRKHIAKDIWKLTRLCSLVAVVCLLGVAPAANAAIDSYEFSSEQNAQRYHALVDELRCPVCLSSNLAGSDSPISADLRRQVFRMVEAGNSPEEIRDYMYARYGDFILYRPRLTPFTLLLYATPVLLVGAGLLVIVRLLRSRRIAALTTTRADDQQSARVDALLAAHGGAAQGTASSASAASTASAASARRDANAA